MGRPHVVIGSEPRIQLPVYYPGSGTIQRGYVMCFDRDAGTATDASDARGFNVEKPAAGNLNHFAGFVSAKTANRTGPCHLLLDVPDPGHGTLMAYVDETCVIGRTKLSVKAGSWSLSLGGDGPVVAIAAQTVDRGTTPGLAQVLAFPVEDLAKQVPAYAATGRGPSPLIWQDCPFEAIQADPMLGRAFFDDFHNTNPTGTAKIVGTKEGWGFFEDTTGVVAVAGQNGILNLLTTAVDNDATVMASGGGVSSLCQCHKTSPRQWWFECRVAFDSITDALFNFFLGVAKTGLMASDGIFSDTDAQQDVDILGFRTLAADGDALKTFYKATGQVEAVLDTIVPVAATYYKLGIHFHGLPSAAAGTDTAITLYQDGAALTTPITTANFDAATFPSNVALGLYFATKNKGGVAGHGIAVDWVKFAALEAA